MRRVETHEKRIMGHGAMSWNVNQAHQQVSVISCQRSFPPSTFQTPYSQRIIVGCP
jgi:hypothetical protein